MTIPGEIFKKTMDAIREQHDSDVAYAVQLGEALGAEIRPYNNSLLVDSLVHMLASVFPDQKKAREEINHFMYELDFGRYHGADVVTIEDLWQILENKMTCLHCDEEISEGQENYLGDTDLTICDKCNKILGNE